LEALAPVPYAKGEAQCRTLGVAVFIILFIVAIRTRDKRFSDFT